jgi:hypothetical protein
MKRAFVLALLVCSLGLSGCGSSANSNSTSRSASSPQPQQSPSPTPAPQPAPAPQPPSPSPAPDPPPPSPPPGPGVAVALPVLSTSSTTAVASPVHFQATATPNGNASVTGYVIYVDSQNVYQNFTTTLDTWVVLSAGNHNVHISAWDSTATKFTAPPQQSDYAINVTGFAPVTPPASAVQISNIDQPSTGSWTVDNNNNVGGTCNDGSIGVFASSSDPDTAEPPASGVGQHFVLNSKCQYDDSLFYWKDPTPPTNAYTNLVWDFWFYLPTSTKTSSIQALEFDLFEALPMSSGVQEFMFGSQCNYATNEWQLWLSNNGNLAWTNAASPCQFSTGTWHHATYFLQRVTPTGYLVIPASLTSTTDTNTYTRFGTVTIDGVTTYFGDVANSTAQSSWSPVLGVQHQLDSAVSGITIDEYVTQESVTMW